MDLDKPKDLGDSEDNNYTPSIEEEDNLGDEDFIIPEDPVDEEVSTRQLIATAESLKLKQRQLKPKQGPSVRDGAKSWPSKNGTNRNNMDKLKATHVTICC
ncbi:hypothetical protein D1007_46700 [Hordeum vulgare]|nr:hypothetical protein D1007_46700 [Hordeum vulgare]